MKIEGDLVVNHRGGVLGKKVNGVWQSKSKEVLAFVAEQEAKPKPKKKAAPKKTEEKLEMVRARDENGHFIADDPDTEVNEAWVVKTAKKVLKKK
jgi:hypothetical protein